MNEFEKWFDGFARNYWTHIGYDLEADEHVSRVAHDAWQAATLAERERCAQVAENGSFFHADAPDAQWARGLAKKIRNGGA